MKRPVRMAIVNFIAVVIGFKAASAQTITASPPGLIQFGTAASDAVVVTGTGFPDLSQTACLYGWFFFPSGMTGFTRPLLSVTATDGTSILQIKDSASTPGSGISLAMGGAAQTSCDVPTPSSNGWMFIAVELNGPSSAFGQTDATLSINNQLVCSASLNSQAYSPIVSRPVASITIASAGQVRARFAGLGWAPFSSYYSYGGSSRSALMSAPGSYFMFDPFTMPSQPFTQTTVLASSGGLTVRPATDNGTLTFVPLQCSPNPCQNGGTCHGQWGNPYCVCPFGTEGSTCQSSFAVTPCSSGLSCMNGGANCRQYTNGVVKTHCDCLNTVTQDALNFCSNGGPGSSSSSSFAGGSTTTPSTPSAASRLYSIYPRLAAAVALVSCLVGGSVVSVW